MADKYKALRDALADDSLTLRHIAVAEDGVCRFMTGRKLPLHLDSMELHGIDSGRGVFDSVAVPKETIRNLLEDRDALEEALVLALVYWKERQQRYKNRSPVWVQKARAALAQANGEPHD